jgi:hypothetical protein
MNVEHERCAGLDVHQKSVVACVRIVGEGKVTHEVPNLPHDDLGAARAGG